MHTKEQLIDMVRNTKRRLDTKSVSLQQYVSVLDYESSGKLKTVESHKWSAVSTELPWTVDCDTPEEALAALEASLKPQELLDQAAKMEADARRLRALAAKEGGQQ